MSAGRTTSRPAARSAARGAAARCQAGAADGRRRLAESARISALVVAEGVGGAAGERRAALAVAVHGHAASASFTHLHAEIRTSLRI